MCRLFCLSNIQVHGLANGRDLASPLAQRHQAAIQGVEYTQPVNPETQKSASTHP